MALWSKNCMCNMDLWNQNCIRNMELKMKAKFSPIKLKNQSLTFQLLLNGHVSHWILNHDTRSFEEARSFEFVEHEALPTSTATAFSFPGSLTRDLVVKTVEIAINTCRVQYCLSRDERRTLVDRVWAEVEKIFKRAYTYGELRVTCNAFVMHQHKHHARIPTKDCHRMAWFSLLEKYEEVEEDCAICLEEVIAGCRGALRMPCSHVFHGGCIKKWLRTSRYCPVCRFTLD